MREKFLPFNNIHRGEKGDSKRLYFAAESILNKLTIIPSTKKRKHQLKKDLTEQSYLIDFQQHIDNTVPNHVSTHARAPERAKMSILLFLS